jgi:hypothetical protein
MHQRSAHEGQLRQHSTTPGLVVEAIECQRHWMRAGLGTTIGALPDYLTETGIKEEALWGLQKTSLLRANLF